MEPPPHPMRLGDTERDYYLLGSAGAPAARGQDDEGDQSGPAAAADWTPDAPRHESGGEQAGGTAADDGSEAGQ
jgi:hypothetical protein